MPVLHLSERELRLVRNLAVEFSLRIGGQLRARDDLTPEGRARYLADLDDVLGLRRKLDHAEKTQCADATP